VCTYRNHRAALAPAGVTAVAPLANVRMPMEIND
jgi:hypothetical protein